MTVMVIVATNLAGGQTLTPETIERLTAAVQRISRIAEAAERS